MRFVNYVRYAYFFLFISRHERGGLGPYLHPRVSFCRARGAGANNVFVVLVAASAHSRIPTWHSWSKPSASLIASHAAIQCWNALTCSVFRELPRSCVPNILMHLRLIRRVAACGLAGHLISGSDGTAPSEGAELEPLRFLLPDL